VKNLLKKNGKAWGAEKVAGFGLTYDNRSSMFTTKALKLPTLNARNEPFGDDVIGITHIGK
jgi:hypothetical protein